MRNSRSEFEANIALVLSQATPRQASWKDPAPVRVIAKRNILSYTKSLFRSLFR
jgi:hypothetical protein